MAEVLRLRATHLDIARWLLENPERPQSECAKHFGYTESWLSTLIHSSAFKAHMAELQSGADQVVMADIPARLRGVANVALEKLGAQLDEVITLGPANRIDRDFVKDTAEMTLKALGYGQKQTPNGEAPQAPNTVIYADKVLIESARDRILERGRVIDQAPNVPEIEQLEQIQASS